jgi:hypothetical protein
MTSSYLDRPLLPLAVALPRMLEKIEAELATATPIARWRLRQRAELIGELLTPGGHGSRAGPDRGRLMLPTQ